MVQFEKLAGIHAAWVAAGSPAHVPQVEREYAGGIDGGDDACTVCGESWGRKNGSHPADSILGGVAPEAALAPARPYPVPFPERTGFGPMDTDNEREWRRDAAKWNREHGIE